MHCRNTYKRCCDALGKRKQYIEQDQRALPCLPPDSCRCHRLLCHHAYGNYLEIHGRGEITILNGYNIFDIHTHHAYGNYLEIYGRGAITIYIIYVNVEVVILQFMDVIYLIYIDKSYYKVR